MKRFFLLLICFVPALYTFADDYDFSALQGLRDKKGNIYFEISGYDIFCSSQNGKINDLQTLAKFKKKYKIKGVQAEYSDSNLPLPNQIIETEQPLEKNPDLKYNQIFYLFAQSKNEIKYIVFWTLNQRDVLLEKEFVKAFLENKLSACISDDWMGESISFVGRTVQLGNACQWRSPHNLFCKGGQVSWSEFSSAESAELDLDMRIISNNKDSSAILSKDYIEITFETIPTIALRVAYMGKNANYPLIVYYVTQEVRGKFVSCTMSNYGYNRNDYELTPLLQQFMNIPSPPDWAYDKFDIPEYEHSANGAKMLNMPWNINYELRLGSVLSLGNLSQVFQYAPSFDLFMCFIIKQKTSIDIGFMVAVPIKRYPFKFTYQGKSFETKTTSMVGASLRYRYLLSFSENLSGQPYLGIGFSGLSTDLVESINKDGQKVYRSVNGLDSYGGFQLRYKKLGYFIEYHQAFYSNSDKVANNFGNSFLNTGFTYSF
jgi:hypothetical protein